MTRAARTFIPPAGRDLFLPLYDPLTTLLGADRVRRRLVDQAGLAPSHRVLDVGCGTGSLVVFVKRSHPDVDVTGFDPDAKALERARKKVERAGVGVRLDQAFSDALEYPGEAFDRVLSSFMFHHLQGEEKLAMLHEVRRVLKVGGRFHMVDFQGGTTGGHGWLLGRLHSHERLKDNTEGRVLELLTEAGFERPARLGGDSLLLGRIAYYRAERPE